MAKPRFFRIHFCRTPNECNFNLFDVLAPKATKFGDITQNRNMAYFFYLYTEKNTWKRCLVAKLSLSSRESGSLNLMAMSWYFPKPQKLLRLMHSTMAKIT